MIPLANHLWQSTIFAAIAVVLTLCLSRNRAQLRYWLWLAASVKFLVPIAPLIEIGRQLEWRRATAVPQPVSLAMEQVSEPFTFSATAFATPMEASAFPWAAVVMAAWFCGFAAVFSIWWGRWRRVRSAVRAASPMPIQAPIPVMSSPTLLEPGVFGILRPVLLLPEGITDRLTPAQLKAILAHEMCHVARRDNLASVIHMAVEAVFWFHPLVWWIGARLVAERERACDEEVLRRGSPPFVYAEGILNVAKFYVESPIACASGVTGADLKKRIEEIMTNRISLRLTFARKALLAAAGIAAVAGPIVIGVVRAQSPEARFEVASIKPGDPNSRSIGFSSKFRSGLNGTNVPARMLISYAFNVRYFQISGGPGWINTELYSILAKPERAEGDDDFNTWTPEEARVRNEIMRQRVRGLLAERFQFAYHKESKEMPVYHLVVAKGGLKMREADGPSLGVRSGDDGRITGKGVSIELLANSFANMVGRPVVDRTGLTARYDFEMPYPPGMHKGFGKPAAPGKPPADPETPTDPTGPSLVTLLQQHLGLKLEGARGPVDIIVIDRIEKPSAN